MNQYRYPDGSEYYGEWEDNQRHGRGTMKFADGSSYIGEFENGLFSRVGVLTLSDHSRSVNPVRITKAQVMNSEERVQDNIQDI